jgi:hypothetical protein
MIAETRGNPLALLERHHRFGEGEYQYSEIVVQLLLRDWDDLGSRETYLEYGCATNFASPGGASRDRPQAYAPPDSLLTFLIIGRGLSRSTGGLGRSTASTPGHGVRRLRRRWPLGSARRAASSDRSAEHW